MSKTVKELELDYLLALWKDTRRADIAAKILGMVEQGDLKLTARKDDKLLFLKSNFDSKCCRCNERYYKGMYIFVKNKTGWHTECATDAEKQHLLYKKYLKTLEKNEN